MEVSMSALAYSLLLSVILGCFLGVIYDTLRIQHLLCQGGPSRFSDIKLPLLSQSKRERSKEKSRRFRGFCVSFLIFAGDILFFFIAAILCVVLLYHTNNGKARWMVFFGMAIGFGTYYFTIGKIVVAFSEYIIFALKTVVLYLVFFLMWPIKRLLALALHAFRAYSIKRYTKREIKRTLNASMVGFLH